MKKISKSSELLWLLGIIFVALGVCICSKVDLGVSMIAAPAFVICEALSSIWPTLTVGVTEYIIQGILLTIMCIIVGRFNWRYLLAFAVAVLYGYTLDLFLWLFDSISFDAIWLRWIMLIVGDIITAFGVACFFETYMPLQVYELFVAEIAHSFKIGISKVKWTFDISLLCISVILAFSLFGDASEFEWSTIYSQSFHSIGLGTLVTTLINSPIIAAMSKLIGRIFEASPRFPRLENLLGRS